MKIQVVTYSVSRYAGGLLGAVSELFTNKGFSSEDISILSFRDDMTEADRDLWGNLPMQLFEPNRLLYSSEALNTLLQGNADILHMEGLWRWPQRWMMSWKTKKGRPVVCSPHGMLDPWIIKEQGKVKRYIAKLFFDKAFDSVDCFHALCEQEYNDIRRYGINKPVAIIPNGINLPDAKLKKRLGTVRHSEWSNKKHLLYLGRLHPKKGVDNLLNAIIRLKYSKNNQLSLWHVDIVGWGDDGYIRLLNKLCREKGIEELVTFHGEKYGDDKMRMYSDCDAYILPSHGEGLPLTILEAWSWNLPVVMTSQCNIPEGFDKEAAIKIEDSIEGCCNGLIKLFSMNDEELKVMGAYGYDLVKEKFTWDAVSGMMIRLYAWLLGQSAKPEFVITGVNR